MNASPCFTVAMSRWRYTYKGPLAEPLKEGEQATDKLPLLLADLGVAPDRPREALLALGIRHISGFRREGPPTRRYEGRLRSRLKPHELSEEKLPLLMQHYGATSEEDCLLAAAIAHVPGFKSASRDTAGRKPTVLDDDVLFDTVCDRVRGTKKYAVLYAISEVEPSADVNNPWHGVDPQVLDEASKPSKVRARTDAVVRKALGGLAKLATKAPKAQ